MATSTTTQNVALIDEVMDLHNQVHGKPAKAKKLKKMNGSQLSHFASQLRIKVGRSTGMKELVRL